jgi:hypothetical protein
MIRKSKGGGSIEVRVRDRDDVRVSVGAAKGMLGSRVGTLSEPLSRHLVREVQLRAYLHEKCDENFHLRSNNLYLFVQALPLPCACCARNYSNEHVIAACMFICVYFYLRVRSLYRYLVPNHTTLLPTSHRYVARNGGTNKSATFTTFAIPFRKTAVHDQ